MSEQKVWNIETQKEIPDERKRRNRMKKEEKRLWHILRDLDDKTLEGLKPLVANLSFLRIQIEDLQAHILKYGVKEEYQNGKNQWGMKESSEFKALNAFIQRYTQVYSQFISLLPKNVAVEVSDGFDEMRLNKPQ